LLNSQPLVKNGYYFYKLLLPGVKLTIPLFFSKI
jgi:hypothetical protein